MISAFYEHNKSIGEKIDLCRGLNLSKNLHKDLKKQVKELLSEIQE